MTESLIAVATIAAVLLAAVFARLGAVERRLRGFSRLDAKLDALLKHSGLRFDPFEGVPPAVREALQRGKKIDAIKHYRAASGADLQEAKEFVEELERRQRR